MTAEKKLYTVYVPQKSVWSLRVEASSFEEALREAHELYVDEPELWDRGDEETDEDGEVEISVEHDGRTIEERHVAMKDWGDDEELP